MDDKEKIVIEKYAYDKLREYKYLVEITRSLLASKANVTFDQLCVMFDVKPYRGESHAE